VKRHQGQVWVHAMGIFGAMVSSTRNYLWGRFHCLHQDCHHAG